MQAVSPAASRWRRERATVSLFVALTCSLGMVASARGQQPEIRVERDIVYGKADRMELLLNLALPKDGKGPFPAVVCIHGGGWRAGKREDMDSMAELLARRGYVAATVSNRLVPTARFPAQIEDCKAAVRSLRANAAKYQINPDRIGEIGPSAGGHLSCLLGVTDKKDGLEGGRRVATRAVRRNWDMSEFGRIGIGFFWNEAATAPVSRRRSTALRREAILRAPRPNELAQVNHPPSELRHGEPSSEFDTTARVAASFANNASPVTRFTYPGVS